MTKINVSLTILILALLSQFMMPLVAQAESSDPITPTVSWSMSTFSTSVFQEWDHETFQQSYQGSYDEMFNYSRTFIHELASDVLVKQNNTVIYKSNYSYYTSTTITGNFSMSLSVNVYKVQVQYGPSSQLFWIAVKEGNMVKEVYVDALEYYGNCTNDYYKQVNRRSDFYNRTTGENIISHIDEPPIIDEGSWNFMDESSIDLKTHKYIDHNFTTPLIMTYQIFTTLEGENVAWVELLNDFIIYEDLDLNGYFSAGEQQSPNKFSFSDSDEFQGSIIPHAQETSVTLQQKPPGGDPVTYEFEYKFPSDKSISEIAENIQFTPPSMTENNGTFNVDWDITYPEFPTAIAIYQDFPFDPLFTMDDNALFENTSPANYSYAYEYALEPERTDLDFMFEFPKITNASAYGLVNGSSLSLPSYNLFLSSQEISESILNVLSVPSSLFEFQMGGENIAEINMGNKDKKFFELYDFPNPGNVTTQSAIGSSVTKLIIDSMEYLAPYSSKTLFVDAIYSIKDLDIVKSSGKFSNAFEYFTVQTLNFPTWSGNRLIYDPTLSTLFSMEDWTPPSNNGSIRGFMILPMILSVILVSFVATVCRKKRFLR